MKIKQFLLAVIFAIAPVMTLLAQADTSQAELGLDFLIGRIIGGYGLGGDLFYNYNHVENDFLNRSFSSRARQFSLTPSLIFGKANLFQVNSKYNYNYYDRDQSNYNDHLFSVIIRYRPWKSLQFNIANEYNSKNTNPDQNQTFVEKSSRQYGLNFGFNYLTQKGTVKYHPEFAKWWYYLYTRQTYYHLIYLYSIQTYSFATSYGIYVLQPLSIETPSILFLNSNQLYVQGFFHYGYEKDKGTTRDYSNYLNKYYVDNQHKFFYVTTHYSPIKTLFFVQEISYSDGTSAKNSSIISSYIAFDPKNQTYILSSPEENSRDDQNSYRYKASLSFLVSKNVLNQFHFDWNKFKSEGYNNYQEIQTSKPHILNSKYSNSNGSQIWSYRIDYLAKTSPISELEILSDYDNYYGHLLNKGAIKITNTLVFQKDRQTFNTSTIDTNLPSSLNRRESTGSSFQNVATISYGLTQKLNVGINLNLEHQYSSSSFTYETSDIYMNSTKISNQINFSYYNFIFDEKNDKQMNWLKLSDFEYWQSPMLRKGMVRVSTSFSLPKFLAGWVSNNDDLFKFYLNKLRSDQSYQIGISVACGLNNKVELDFDSIFSSSKYSLQYSSDKYHFEKEKRNYLNFYYQLKWQVSNDSRLTLSYRFATDKSENPDEYDELKWHDFSFYLDFKILL